MINISKMDLLLYKCRRIFLRDLTQMVSIGIHPFERNSPQRILFNIDLYIPLAESTPCNDLIEEVVDYDFVRHVIQKISQERHIELQETLCDAILTMLLQHPQIFAVRVSMHKPDVYPNCSAVGVETFRCKVDFDCEKSQ
jgi:dihydroneopterin aldolase